MSEPDRGAVLQFEIDRKRWREALVDEIMAPTAKRIAGIAIADTINNGGTFVLVVTADKITIVQRPDTDDGLDEEVSP